MGKCPFTRGSIQRRGKRTGEWVARARQIRETDISDYLGDGEKSRAMLSSEDCWL